MPFTDSAVAPRQEKAEAVQEISDLCHTLTAANIEDVFSDVGDIYTNPSLGLQAKVLERRDAHFYGEPEGATKTVGKFIDAQITDAVEEGTSGELNLARAWDHCEIVQKLLDVYVYLSVYHEINDGTGEGLDKGYGYYGVALDGSTVVGGLASVAVKRGAEFNVGFNADMMRLFNKAGGILREHTADATTEIVEGSVLYWPVVHTMDLRMMQVLASSVIHEFYDLREADHPVSEVVEARVYWWGLSNFAHAVDAERAAEIESLLYEGNPIPTWGDDDFFHEGITGDADQRAAFLAALEVERIILLVSDFAFAHLEFAPNE